MSETKTTCCYCGTGCGVIIESDGDRITGVHGDPDHPANFGRLCSKGATLHLTARHEGRLLHPALRPAREEHRRPVSWDLALGYAAQRFARTIREHGPDAVAFYVSGQLLTEDYYVFNKLARALVGTNNIDSNSRLCMSSAVAAYTQTLGADAPPCSFDDLAAADCILIAGSNTAYAHPIVFRRIEDARRANPELRLIVVDPRRTDTAACADLHLALLPGTDVTLYSAMLHVLLWEDLIDRDFIRDHTEGFDALRDAVREITPAVAASVCGIAAEDIVTAARWFGGAKAALSLWCQGLNQSAHGTHNGAALIHLHLATGQIGRAGAGPFSLTGQPNAMGGREVGAMATLLSGHRQPGNPEHRAEMARFWGVPALPSIPGKSAVELFEAVRRGEIKALWIACTNPAQSLPQQARVREALDRAEFVVLQEAFRNTETAEYADLLLPAAAWGEKEGTLTNSERRIGRVGRAVPPPGEARPDWQIARDFALHLGRALDRHDAPQLFSWFHPEQIFREHAETTRGRDLDITGLAYALLDARGPQQWPFPEGAREGTARLYADRRFATPDGRARFIPLVRSRTAESADARFPLQLNTGRLRDQWHGMSRTGRVPQLFNHEEAPRLLMNAEDMARRGVRENDLVTVRSRRGEVVLPAAASGEIRAGQAFLAMHWGRRFLSNSGANELVSGVLDPYSKQPELKHAAIQASLADLPWQAFVVRSEGAAHGQALAWMEALQPLLGRFGYAGLALAGRETAAVVLRLANDVPAPSEWLDAIDRILGMEDAGCLSYHDRRRGIRKKARIEEGRLVGVHLAGETAAGGWLKDLVVAGRPADDVRRWLLAPMAAPPEGMVARGRVVCSCNNVAEADILAAVAAGASLDTLQEGLRCGTGCGSCVPELKRLIVGNRAAA
ncbi:MAG: nitrate reductase [Rhodocyclaceae bacterium]|jgi:assimilatory nitrate reductase catalytic subunit|nr:nitrate reductase [Rhodocyclaceae bacterium]